MIQKWLDVLDQGLGIPPKGIIPQTVTSCTRGSIAASLIAVKNQKRPKYLSTEHRLNTCLHLSSTAYYAVMKNDFPVLWGLHQDHLLNGLCLTPAGTGNHSCPLSGAPSGPAAQFFVALATFQPERLLTLLIFCCLLAPVGREVPRGQASVCVLFTDESQALEQVPSMQHLVLNEWYVFIDLAGCPAIALSEKAE